MVCHTLEWHSKGARYGRSREMHADLMTAFRLRASLDFDIPGMIGIHGEVVFLDEEGGPIQGNNPFSAYVVSLASDPLVAADDESADLLEAISAVWDFGSSDIRGDLDFVGLGTDILHLDQLRLELSWRGQGLGIEILKRLIVAYGRSACVCTCVPMPIEEIGDRDVGQQKLQQHWRKMGFNPVPDSDNVFYLDPAIVIDDFEARL